MQLRAQLRLRGAPAGARRLRLLPRSRHGRSAATLALLCCGCLALFAALASGSLLFGGNVADWTLATAILGASAAAVGAGLSATVAIMHEDERSLLVRLALLLGWLVLAVATALAGRP